MTRILEVLDALAFKEVAKQNLEASRSKPLSVDDLPIEIRKFVEKLNSMESGDWVVTKSEVLFSPDRRHRMFSTHRDVWTAAERLAKLQMGMEL